MSDQAKGAITDEEIMAGWEIGSGGFCVECPMEGPCRHELIPFARALLALAGERVIAVTANEGYGERAPMVIAIRRILGVKHE